MRKACWIGMAIATLLAPALARAAEAKEEKVAVKDLPKVVVAVVNAMFPDGQIVEAVKDTETEDGKTMVEFDVTVKPKEGDAVEVEFTMDDKGQIKSIKVEDDDDGEDDDNDNDEDDE